MGIKKENNNTYTVSYAKRHPVTGRPYSARRKGVKTIKKAKQVHDQLVLQVDKKIHRLIMPEWQDFLDEYFQHLESRDLTRGTIMNHTSCIKAHTSEWNNKPVNKISGMDIRSLIKSSVGHRSVFQQKNMYKYLKSAFSYACEKDYLQRNPTPNLTFKIPSKIKKVLTKKEVKLFLERARDMKTEWYPIWSTALYTGMRNGELFALTWDKVDLQNKRILINYSWNKKSGFKSTKSGDDRYAEIAPELLSILRELKLKSKDSEYVLPRIAKWCKGEQARELRMFLLGCGLPSVRFHDLRATWATLMLNNGIPPIKVMAMGGWKNIRTLQVYLRVAGLETKGISDGFNLHDPTHKQGKVLNLN